LQGAEAEHQLDPALDAVEGSPDHHELQNTTLDLNHDLDYLVRSDDVPMPSKIVLKSEVYVQEALPSGHQIEADAAKTQQTPVFEKDLMGHIVEDMETALRKSKEGSQPSLLLPQASDGAFANNLIQIVP